jgi:hypothetical protein
MIKKNISIMFDYSIIDLMFSKNPQFAINEYFI